MLPMVDGAAMHFTGIPTPSFQQGRCFRIGLMARLAFVPLHSHLSPPTQKPGMTAVCPPLGRIPSTTMGTFNPIPGATIRPGAQCLGKCLGSFYNVHGLFDLLGIPVPPITLVIEPLLVKSAPTLISPTHFGTESAPTAWDRGLLGSRKESLRQDWTFDKIGQSRQPDLS